MPKRNSEENPSAGNGYVLTPQELDSMRRLLLQKREELTSHQDAQLRELTTDKHHIADLEEMAADINTDSCCEILEIGTSTVEQIDRALEKLTEGTYGICEECEEAIPRARLDALPFAGLCIKCKRQKELAPE